VLSGEQFWAFQQTVVLFSLGSSGLLRLLEHASIWMCVCVGFLMCVSSGNMCTCFTVFCAEDLNLLMLALLYS
jgi:hypothetical protein